MAGFKTGKSGTRGDRRDQGGGDFTYENRITKDGVLWVPPKLTKEDEGEKPHKTEIRLFPPVEDDGTLCLPLNPEATADMPLREKLAPVFLNTEIAHSLGGLQGRGRTLNMITSVTTSEEDGEDIPGGWTPAKEFVIRMRSKIMEQSRRKKAGLDIDVPEEWLEYEYGGTNRDWSFTLMRAPQGGGIDNETGAKRPEAYLVQCLALTVDGAAKKNPETGKLRMQGPAVFQIPMSALSQFFGSLTTKLDDDQPLSSDNNQLGDIFSLEDGRSIVLTKLDDKHYGIQLGPKRPLTLEAVQKFYRDDWNELVHLPTVEESIRMLHEAFDDPRMIDYALRPVEGKSLSGQWYRYVPEEWKGSADDIEEALTKDELDKLLARISKKRQAGDEPADAEVDASPEVPDDTEFDTDDDDTDDDDTDNADDTGDLAPVADDVDDLDMDAVPEGIDPNRYANTLSNLEKQLHMNDDDDNDDTSDVSMEDFE